MLGRPGDWNETDAVLVHIETARYLDEPLTNRGAYHLHLGSGAWPVRMRLVDGAQLSGRGPALLQLSQPLTVKVGDRFILREVGRRAVVAGGRVLDPHPSGTAALLGRSVAGLLGVVDASPDERATALLAVRGRDLVGRLASDTGGGAPEGAVVAGALALSNEEADQLLAAAQTVVADFHRLNPLRPGIPKASLASSLDLDPAVVDELVSRSPSLRDDGATVAAQGFGGKLTAEQEQAWEDVRATLEAAGPTVPRIKELGIDRELLHVLVREERVVRIGDELIYLPEQIDEIIGRLGRLPGKFTVAEFRDAYGLSRKYAVPLLEYLDGRRITLRDGDFRTLRTPEKG
jgi:selenocysteine-specific elongation factor